MHNPEFFFFSEFCTNEITERQFKHSVASLNQNILYLCFSQSVPNPERLDPRNTLQNIVVLLSCPLLGRYITTVIKSW